FVETAVFSFFNNDPETALKLFKAMPQQTSSFGMEFRSTLDPEAIFILCEGQPITIGQMPEENWFTYASEAGSVIAKIDSPQARLLDLEDENGEIAIIRPGNLRLFSLKTQKELSPLEIEKRWIHRNDNPYIIVPAIPKEGEDNIRQDLDD